MKPAIRQEIERKIIKAAVTSLIREGFNISVWDGESYQIKNSITVGGVMAAIMSTDEDTLIVRDSHDTPMGKIFLVYGNDGYDVIHDYSVNLEKYLDNAIKLADKYAA